MLSHIALILAMQTPLAQTDTSSLHVEAANILLGRMFSHYADAKTLTSKIRMTQTAMNKTVQFETTLSYERPFKIFFVQKRSGQPNYSPHLVSDGTHFEYPAPDNIDNKRVQDFTEKVHSKEGDITIAEMWPMAAESLYHGDDNFILEAMISRPSTLRTLRGEFQSFTNKGKINYGNKVVNDIEGRWRNTGFGEEGDFKMYVTDEGDIVRHETKMKFGVNATWLIQHHLPATAYSDGIEVTTVWEAETTVDQPTNQTLYHLAVN